MAINIFSGGSGRSSSGNSKKVFSTVETKVGKPATSGVAKVIGKVGSFAEKYGNLIPGIGGAVSAIGKIFSKNDPEWWQNVPGTGVSTNISLTTQSGNRQQTAGLEVVIPRCGIVEFAQDWGSHTSALTGAAYDGAFAPLLSEVTTYLMQNVRKVVNAIPLQQPEAYRQILINQATAYALKHQLDKFIVLTTNAKPFMPTVTDGSYPILAANNYAILVSLRDRLAEFCKASVRLPHTLCQYLAWRFGRIYRTGSSEKCGYVLYNILSLSDSIQSYIDYVNMILGFAAAPSGENQPFYDAPEALGGVLTPTEKQAAQADLFNAYMRHVMDVEIKPETQFTYDPKEFVLRTNLDVQSRNRFWSESNGTSIYRPDPEFIYMDSALDNKTTFMASTVSTEVNGNALFPVRMVTIYATGAPTSLVQPGSLYFEKVNTEGSWYQCDFSSICGYLLEFDYAFQTQGALDAQLSQRAFVAALCKNMELYNMEIYVPTRTYKHVTPEEGGGTEKWTAVGQVNLDATALAQDLAFVTTDIIANTQVYAFANLVYDGVVSYAAKEMPAAIKEAEKLTTDVVSDMTTVV